MFFVNFNICPSFQFLVFIFNWFVWGRLEVNWGHFEVNWGHLNIIKVLDWCFLFSLIGFRWWWYPIRWKHIYFSPKSLLVEDPISNNLAISDCFNLGLLDLISINFAIFSNLFCLIIISALKSPAFCSWSGEKSNILLDI